MFRVASVLTFALAAAVGFGGAAFAQEAAVTPASAPEPAIGPAPNPAHPMGGYLPHPAPSKILIAADKAWIDAKGRPLYVMDRECNGQCAVLFPPLTPQPGAKPPSKDWTIRIREENGDLQWVYKGRPVYTYVEDKPDEHPKAHGVLPGISLAQK